MLIKSYYELDQWLESLNYFEDGYLLRIDHDPFAIVIGIMISGRYVANSPKEIFSFKIQPKNVMLWDYARDDFVPSEHHIIESIEPLEAENGIALEFFLPPMVTLIAESLTISEEGIIKSIVKPWLGPKEFFVHTQLSEIPRPHFWKQKFQEFEYNIVFRYFAGEGKQPEETPYPNYIGYFIQLAEKVSTTKQGIFVSYVGIKDNMVSMGFQLYDDDLHQLWILLAKIVADFPKVQISCGNCKLTGEEWKQILKENRYLPKYN